MMKISHAGTAKMTATCASINKADKFGSAKSSMNKMQRAPKITIHFYKTTNLFISFTGV